MGWMMTYPIYAQTSKAELLAHMELATGNYCNYPLPSGNVTPAPDGDEPFYVSHYGRHGARYMTDDDHYKYVIGKMDTAQIRGWLTDKGQEVLLYAGLDQPEFVKLLVEECDRAGAKKVSMECMFDPLTNVHAH